MKTKNIDSVEHTVMDVKCRTAVNHNGSQNVKEDQMQRTMLKSAAGVVGSGILLGTISSLVSDHSSAEVNAEDLLAQAAENGAKEDNNLGWSDGEVLVADLNDPNMSFSEAFAAARSSVGPGGAFEWHGKVFTTYTADEWSAISSEGPHQFENHFRLEENSHAQPVYINGDDIEIAADNDLVADNEVAPASVEVTDEVVAEQNSTASVDELQPADVSVDDIQLAAHSDEDVASSDDELVASVDDDVLDGIDMVPVKAALLGVYTQKILFYQVSPPKVVA